MKPTVARAPHLRGLGRVIISASLGVIAVATLLPEPGTATGSHFCLLCGPVGGVSAILNVFLFVPFGLGLALCGMPWRRALATAVGVSIVIETAQFLVVPGRYAALGDVITNGIGGALGFAIGRYGDALLRPSRRLALTLVIAWSAIWLVTEAISAFGFTPRLTRTEYYGQIARQLGDFEQFQGRVLRARVGPSIIPDSDFEDDGEIRELLLRGAPVTATIIPAAPAAGLAPILRIADSSDREMVLLAQNGRDLVFGVRTGAAWFRLRPPVVALADIFPVTQDRGATHDSIAISVSYSANEASLHEQAMRNVDRRIRITASLGWTLLTPFQWFIEGTPEERLVSAVWMASLLLPLGYWGLSSTVAYDAGARIVAIAAAFALLYLGLTALPQVFGVHQAPVGDWLAAGGGLLVGGLLRLARVGAKSDLRLAGRR